MKLSASEPGRDRAAAGPHGAPRVVPGIRIRAASRPCPPPSTTQKIRVVVAKPGLDGHDRGAKIIARALRDAGMEVIYTGLHQTPEQIVETVIQEDADAVGLSILSGAHMTLVPRIVELLREQGVDDVLVTVGGTIPADDIPELKELGVAEVFTPGRPDAGHHRLHPGRGTPAWTRADARPPRRSRRLAPRPDRVPIDSSVNVGTIPTLRLPRGGHQVKICVLVKEVPDAAVQKRIDPSTGRMDRSGEKNLNPYDTHAIEAAMQVKEGGARRGRRDRRRDDGPVERGPRAAQGGLARRRPLGPPDRRRARGLRRRRDRLRARADARARVARPRPARPAVRRRRVLHDRRRRGRPPADAVAHAGHQDGRRRRQAHAASARPSTATTPSRSRCRPSSPSATRSTSRATRRSRRSWARRRSRSTRVAIGDVGIDAGRVGEDGSRVACGEFKAPPAEGRRHDHRGRGHERDGREDRRLARREEADLMARATSSSTPSTTRASSTRTPSAPSPRARALAGELGGECHALVARRRRPHRRPGRLARRLRRGEGLPRQGPRGPRAAGRRRDGQGHGRRRPPLRAVRRRPARLRDRRRPRRAPGRRRDDGGHGRPRRGRQARSPSARSSATRRSRRRATASAGSSSAA